MNLQRDTDELTTTFLLKKFGGGKTFYGNKNVLFVKSLSPSLRRIIHCSHIQLSYDTQRVITLKSMKTFV